MVSKESWINQRRSGTIDLEHLHFGLNLNPTVDLNIDKLQELLNIIKLKVPFAVNHLVKECKNNLDKHFNIVTLHKNGKEIKVLN